MLNTDMVRLGVQPSCIRELFEYGLRQARIVGAENVYDFSLGNPSIPAPPEVDDAIKDLLLRGDDSALHGYTSARGAENVRRAIAEDLNARFQAGARPENLFITCGCAPGVIASVRALSTDGAEVIAVAPYFSEYRTYIEAGGAKFVPVEADTERFQIRLDALAARLSPHTQAVLINSPNNPSGVVYTRETLTALADILRQKSAAYGHPIYIIADEPYRELVYDGAEAAFVPAIYADTIVCYSYSKSLSLPGERIGYVFVPDAAADSAALMNAVAGAARALGHVCAPSLFQQVIARCAHVRPDVAAYDRNRLALYEALTEYGYRCVKPNGAFYLFAEAPGGSARAFSARAREKNLLLVPGDDFGCPDYFRVSTCVPYEMILRSLPAFRSLIREG